jgi:hypothetical protein
MYMFKPTRLTPIAAISHGKQTYLAQIPQFRIQQPPTVLQRQRALFYFPRVLRIVQKIICELPESIAWCVVSDINQQDISGRSPILQADSFTSRTSLDSRPASRYPTRSTLNSTTFERPATAEEGFEDVKLNEEAKQQPKKKSFLSRFGDSSGETTTKEDGKHHFHILPGRKRGQSGTGSELGDMPRPQSNGKAEVSVR